MQLVGSIFNRFDNSYNAEAYAAYIRIKEKDQSASSMITEYIAIIQYVCSHFIKVNTMCCSYVRSLYIFVV